MHAKIRPILVAAAVLTPVIANAAPIAPKGRAAVLQEVLECRTKASDAERLACYDAAVARMDQAEAKGDIVVVDREQAREVRRQAFGFTLPSLSILDRGDKPEQLDRVSGTIEGVRSAGGKWVLTLKDGAVWRQLDNESPARDPKPGMPVEIKAAAMGSYLLSVDGQRSFRARRDQ